MRSLLLIALFALFSVSSAYAQATFTWTGGAGGAWANGENWNGCTNPPGPCPAPGADDFVVFPDGSGVNVDVVLVLVDGMTVQGSLTVTGGDILVTRNSTSQLTLEAGALLQIDGDPLEANVLVDTATSEVTGAGVLEVATASGLLGDYSVDELRCIAFVSEICDFTMADVTSPNVSILGSGTFMLDDSAVPTMRTIRVDNFPLGGGGPGSGDIVFSGSPATFDLTNIFTFDNFGNIDFNNGDVTVDDIEHNLFNENGLLNINNLVLEDSLAWHKGTIEVNGVFSVPTGSTVVSDGDTHLIGLMEVAGTLIVGDQTLDMEESGNTPTQNGDITILPGGLLSIPSDCCDITGGGTLTLQGQLQVDASGGSNVFKIAPDSVSVDGGTVEVIGGLLAFDQGGGFTSMGGTFTVADGTTLEISSELPYAVDAASTVSGAGTLLLEAGPLNTNTGTFSAGITTATLEVSVGNSVADLTSGTVDVSTIFNDSGELLLPSNATTDVLIVEDEVVFSTGGTFDFQTLDVEGLVDFGAADVTVADVFNNGSFATIDNVDRLTLLSGITSATWNRATINATDVLVESGVLLEFVGVDKDFTGTFTNQGTIQHTDGDFDLGGPFINDGTYNFEITSSGRNIEGGGLFTNNGVFQRADATVQGLVDTPFENPGTVRLLDGDLQFGGFGGSIVNTGVIEGSGTLDLPDGPIGGTISPGLSPGLISIDGDLTLDPSAEFKVEISGVVPGTGHDQIAVSDDAVLDGLLAISFPGGFYPSIGESFTILAAATVTGTFSSITAEQGYTFSVAYNPNDVVITVTDAPAVVVETAPQNAPIVLPPTTSFVYYDVTFFNTSDVEQEMEVWMDIDGAATRHPIKGPGDLNVPLEGIGPVTFQLRVPGAAPAGTYILTTHVGDFQAEPISSSAFTFEKAASLSADRSDRTHENWQVAEVTDGPPLVLDQAVARGDETLAESPELSANSSIDLPDAFALHPAYPNPFNPSATIGFDVPESASARLAIYDVLGREVVRLVDTAMEPGRHEVRFDASNLPSGVYFVRFTADSAFTQTQRITLLK